MGLGASPNRDFQQSFEAANGLFREQRYAEAQALYRQLLDLDPDSAALLCRLGDTAHRLGRHGEASLWFDRAEAADPRFAWTHAGRAELLAALGRRSEAIDELQRASLLDPSLAFIGERIAALRREAGAAARPADFADRFTAANALFDAGRLLEAEAEYRSLLQHDSRSAPLFTKLAAVLVLTGRHSEAETVLGWAEAIDPDFAWIYVTRADLHEARSEFESAIAELKRARRVDPTLTAIPKRLRALRGKATAPAEPSGPPSFRDRFDAANALFDARRFAEAGEAYRRLLDSDPMSAPLLTMLGNVALQFGREAEALGCFDRAESIDPDYPWLHLGRAELLAARGESDAAIAALERVRGDDPPRDVVERRMEAIRNEAREKERGEEPPEIIAWPPTRAAAAVADDRPRVTVVSWDLAHNPVGRAWVLAELAASWSRCELVGPLYPAYGDDLWPPLRDSVRRIAIKGFAAPSFASFVAGAIRLVRENPCDVAWVSKPRFPSLFIGFLCKLMHGAPVVCDIDDDELAFVGAERPLALDVFLAGALPSDWRDPHGARWTQLAQSMIGWADAVTVCNPVLREKHGGFLIRHARDELVFDPGRFDRQAVRAEFGFSPADKVVLFLGTPRRHKGILQLAEALSRIGDRDVVLCVIGAIPDRSLREDLERFRGLRIVCRPDVPFHEVPRCNLMADAVCILQDGGNAVARYQTPAKLTDALAMGTPVVAVPVPPIADLVGPGGIVAAEAETLTERLREVLDAGPRAVSGAEARRAFFLSELSYGANAARARSVIELSLLKPSPVPDGFLSLLRHIDACMPGGIASDLARSLGDALPSRPRAGQLRSIDRNLNLVFFWKQNDSGLYGRRQEMLLDQFARLPRFRRILHIDAPISIDALDRRLGSGQDRDEGRFVVARTLARFLRTEDDGPVHRRSFVHRGQTTSLFGRDLPYKESFPNMVEGWLRELGMLDNLIAWVCPVAPMFPEVAARLEFPLIVADVIDDQREWPASPAWRASLERNYRRTFALADLAFANCQPVADWLGREGLSPVVVPNGMELHPDVESWPAPPALARMRRPIVGYVGNLHDRIDWPLIAALADAHPDWSIVLIGSAPPARELPDLAARPNIRLLGVVPYRQAIGYVAAFDAAMVPHLASPLSDRMNPLKLYVYRSLGVPVVSTAIANLDDFAEDIRIARTPRSFISQLEAAIEDRRYHGRTFPDPVRMRQMSWERRTATIVDHIERAFREKVG